MIKWINIPDSTKRNAYIQIAEKTGMSPFAVEKDWWVSRTLEIIFQMQIAKYMVFKGGTSLSKAWKLINRFSEDIDLAIDMQYFNYNPKDITKSKITKLRKEAGQYTTGQFFIELQEMFQINNFNNLVFKAIEAKDSDQDPRIIEIYYPNLIKQPSQYVLPRVQIEISIRSLREPYTLKTFGAYVDEFYPDKDFAQPLFTVPTVKPERTFLEKLFLLHEEFSRPAEKRRIDRLSRHLYDVYQLTKEGIAQNAINNKELYETIVAHRYKFSRVGQVNYNLHNPKTLNPIPSQNIIQEWKSDYAKMNEEMIYDQNKVSFQEIINTITNLKTQLNSLSWTFQLHFPTPKNTQ